MSDPHIWIRSTLGHGEAQCIHCLATNREIAVIGDLNHCEVAREKRLKAEKESDPKAP